MKVKIIAEVGNLHEGSLGLAKCCVRAAAQCGVDAVKFQTHIFDAESVPQAPNPSYFKDETRKQYFERTAFTQKQWESIKAYCEKDCKVEFISSPFSIEAIELLEAIGVNTYKIPSGEVTNHPLLVRVAKTGKKILLSTGMSYWSELDAAISVLEQHGSRDITLLQCTSEYPCTPEHSGLNILSELKRYEYPVGFSDHSMGVALSIAAVTLGATVIEKHFTLSNDMYGSDAKISTEPDQFKVLVQEIRSLECALSHALSKDALTRSVKQMKTTFEKSIVTRMPMKKGDVIQEKHLAFKKPGNGLPPKDLAALIGKKLVKNVPENHLLCKSDYK